MALQSHIAELVEKHRKLEEKLHDETRRPSCDDILVSELKREKLRLKDEIERLTMEAEEAA